MTRLVRHSPVQTVQHVPTGPFGAWTSASVSGGEGGMEVDVLAGTLGSKQSRTFNGNARDLFRLNAKGMR